MCYNPEGREITLVDRGPPRPLSLLSGLLREVLGVPEAGDGRDEDARTPWSAACELGPAESGSNS